MKILLVCQSYPFKQGGVETRIREVALHAIRDGHDVTMLCAKTDLKDPEFEVVEGIKVYCEKMVPDAWIRRWPYPHYFPLAISKFLLGRLVRKFHRKERFQIIREDMAPVPVSGLWALFRIKGATRVLLVHNLPDSFSGWRKIYGLFYGSIGYFFEFCLKQGWLKFDRILSPSPYCAKNLGRFPHLSGKLRVVYNGIRLSEFPKMKQIYEARGPLRFLAVGRLVPLKGFAVLLEAFAELNGSVPNACLCIIGDGPSYSALEASAKRLGIEGKVELRTSIPHPKLIKTYQEFDYFVMPSSFEGFSLVTLEAMASGLPLILSDIPGLRDIVEDEGALFFVPGDSRDLASKLLWATRNPEAMQARAEKSLSIVQKFDWEKVCAREEAMMSEMGSHA